MPFGGYQLPWKRNTVCPYMLTYPLEVFDVIYLKQAMCTGGRQGRVSAHAQKKLYVNRLVVVKGWRLQWDITFLGSFTVSLFHRPLPTPHTLCLSLLSPGPSNALLSYQQLHQQVDLHHPQVCSHAVKYTPPRLQGLCVKFPLSWRQSCMSVVQVLVGLCVGEGVIYWRSGYSSAESTE